MRAKRSKKYRKIMESYGLIFSFHEPYQVLLDAAFLKTCHAFHMPLRKFLENTLHGQCKLLMTQCTLAKIMREHTKNGASKAIPRPEFLPPPTEMPLRYCKHDDQRAEKGDSWGEENCLLDLLSGMPKGNEVPKNKWHYVLATAEDVQQSKQAGGRKPTAQGDVREKARMIPGVPVVYVKRSVMVLEEMSTASIKIRNGQEKDKFREGLVGGRKRKREDGEDEDSNDGNPLTVEQDPGLARRGMRKPKAPNPLSVLKKKVKKAPEQNTSLQPTQTGEEDHDAEAAETNTAKSKEDGNMARKNQRLMTMAHLWWKTFWLPTRGYRRQ